jgi:hypothetical protein
VVSIPIVSVDGTEQVIFPGTPTAVLPWWQRTDPAVPDTTAQPLLTGYLHFWDVRAQALSTLQPAALPQVMDGPPLTGEQAAIDQLRAAGQTQHVDVQHQIQILWATPQEGAVRDTLTDRSTFVPVDPTPNTPSSPPDASTYNMAYRLQLSGGTWKVIDSVRIVS